MIATTIRRSFRKCNHSHYSKIHNSSNSKEESSRCPWKLKKKQKQPDCILKVLRIIMLDVLFRIRRRGKEQKKPWEWLNECFSIFKNKRNLIDLSDILIVCSQENTRSLKLRVSNEHRTGKPSTASSNRWISMTLRHSISLMKYALRKQNYLESSKDPVNNYELKIYILYLLIFKDARRSQQRTLSLLGSLVRGPFRLS